MARARAGHRLRRCGHASAPTALQRAVGARLRGRLDDLGPPLCGPERRGALRSLLRALGIHGFATDDATRRPFQAERVRVVKGG
eukprot:1474874-Pyramimonas_sp.AAC.1